MDRVSLRLLVVALIFNLGFGLSFSFATVLAKETMPCAFLTFFANAGHRAQSKRAKDGKFYYLGPGILATGCSVTPLAAGVFGHQQYRRQNSVGSYQLEAFGCRLRPLTRSKTGLKNTQIFTCRPGKDSDNIAFWARGEGKIEFEMRGLRSGCAHMYKRAAPWRRRARRT
ncbi:hypothetical protein B0H14DRAFT_2602020 [Mycena olivaceomarginata]|nr:hypothetical protein B0H14DRAFT_2602020 [Mycena olivaceomarginata]